MAASVNMCVQHALKLQRLTHSLLFVNRTSVSRCCRLTSTATNGKPETETGKTDDQKPAEESTELSLVEKRLTEDNDKLTTQLGEFKDKYLRSLAETENVRDRMKKQVDDAKIFGIQGFCKDLLEVADILGTATETVPRDQLETNPHLKDLFQGLTMTESQLQKAFIKHGLHQITPAEGDKFDPFQHEALFEVPTTDKENGTVAMIQKIGYRLNDRTIRPALVGVFKAT